MSTSCYSFYYFLFVLTPNFCPSPLQPPAANAATVCNRNTMSNIPDETPLPLALSRVQYSGWDASLSPVTLWEMETEPSKPSLLFCQVGHFRPFLAHYARSCPPASLLLPSLLSLISASFLVLRLPIYPAYILLSSLSCLSATYLLLLSQSSRVSTAKYAAILVHHLCHLAFLIPL